MKKSKATATTSFGVGKREGHDASAFYGRSLYAQQPALATPASPDLTPVPARAEWADRIYCQSAEQMTPIPDNSVALAFTSPPYNVGKTYDDDMTLEAYLALIRNVASEIYRALLPGGRYVVNIANLGRKPYIPLHMHFYQEHMAVGFLPMGEIIWRKAKGAGGSCAWGSWQSAKAPRCATSTNTCLSLPRVNSHGPTAVSRTLAVMSSWPQRCQSGRSRPSRPSEWATQRPFRWR